MKTFKLLLALTIATLSISAYSQDYKVNTVKSSLKWTGKKVTGQHYGFINLKEGKFTFKNNKIIDGTFVIDMNTISNVDVENFDYRQKLVDHLKSDDFFGVENFPTSTLVISESSDFKNGTAEVKGKLTIKGITNPISFTVKKIDNDYFSTLTVDRSLYNVRYGSGKFFENLGDNTIYDEFTLEVKISAL